MATDRAFDPSRFDVSAAAAAATTVSGEWPLESLPRLAAACLPGTGHGVQWQASGLRAALAGVGTRPALQLAAVTTVEVECQRCLQPMQVSLSVDRRIFFVEGEDAAAALDAENEDDVLGLEAALDLRGLLEDELLLALPLVPRHEACPQPLTLRTDEVPVEHPFAALAALKGRTRPG